MKKLNLGKYTKYLIGFLCGVLIVGLGFWYYSERSGAEYRLDETGELIPPVKRLWESDLKYQERYLQRVEGYKEYRDEFYRQDVYGGETPEETLQMYIEALENRDFDLASKYFVLEDQERELKELKKLNEEKLKNYLVYLKMETKSSYMDIYDEYEFDIYLDGEYVLLARFSKNKENNLWKLESL